MSSKCTTHLTFAKYGRDLNARHKAGATQIKPAQDYDYGYRHAEIKEPLGHLWLIEKKIS